MKGHIAKAQHNSKFHLSLCSSFTDSYFDWKITASFYEAIHWLRALAKKENRELGAYHEDIKKNINGDKYPNATMPLSKGPLGYYTNLYKLSQQARYNVFEDIALEEEINKSHYEQAVVYLEKFKKELIEKRGINTNLSN